MRALPLFALGLALGTAATWLLTRPDASGLPAPGSLLPAPRSSLPPLPPWSWRDSATPPTLAADPAAAAIAAWHALRAPDGSPAAFAPRADALRALLVRLPATAFPRLLTPLCVANLSEDDRSLRQIAFTAWIETDPAGASAWAVATPDLPDLARQAVSAWAALDARAAATWACALPDEPAASQLAAIALPALATIDSAHALALASSRGDAFLDKLLPGLLGALAKSDPASALRTYGPRLWKNGEGFWRLQETLRAWSALDPAAAIAWMVSQPTRDDGRINYWLGELAGDATQRAALAAAIVTVPRLPNRLATLTSLLSSWTAKHPAEALAWLDTLGDRKLRTALLERASRSIYPDRPEQTLPLVLALPEGADRTERLGELLGQWAKKDASAALAWLHENAAAPGVPAASRAVQTSLLATIARDEPATAVAEWQALPEGPLKTEALASITQAWGQTDPAAALRWAVEQTAKTSGAIHYQSPELVYAWARKDGPTALRWAEALPDDKVRRHALHSLAGTWQDRAPRAATADLYAQIRDPALRTETLTPHLHEWLTKDRPAAQAWLESHDTLTPEQTAALLVPAR